MNLFAHLHLDQNAAKVEGLEKQMAEKCPRIQKKFWLQLSNVAKEVGKDINNNDTKNILWLIKRAFNAYHHLYKLEDTSDAKVKRYIQSLLRHLLRVLKMLEIIATYDDKDVIVVLEKYYYPIKHHFLLHIYRYCTDKIIDPDDE